MTVSMGFVEAVPPDYLAPEEMIKRADTRMYAIKGHWKTSVGAEVAA